MKASWSWGTTVFDILDKLRHSGSYGPRLWTSCEIEKDDLELPDELKNSDEKYKFDVLALGYETKEPKGRFSVKRSFHPQRNVMLLSTHLRDKYLYYFLENLYEYAYEILEYRKINERKVQSYKKIISIIAPNCKYTVCERCGYDYEIIKKMCPTCYPTWNWGNMQKKSIYDK